jgi:hypothetical protein
MSDAVEDTLRAHFAEKAARVQASPDPDALMGLSAGRSGRRRTAAFGAVVLAATLLGSGVLAGAQLAGGRSTATPLAGGTTTTTAPGRAGASLAPDSAGGPNLPATAGPTPYTFLFARTTSSGVTIRSYSTAGDLTGVCTQSAACAPVPSPPGPVTCPPGAMCAQPSVAPPAQGGTTGSGSVGAGGTASSGTASSGTASSGPATPTVTPETLPPASGTTTTTTATASPQPVAACAQVVVELSTDKAVGTAWVNRPSVAPAPNAVDILGTGSFGTQESAPVGWVAVLVGSGVASVNLSSGSTVVDSMVPSSGLVVLALPGNPALTGVSVIGVDQSGSTVATAPVEPATGSTESIGCTTLPVNPPSSVPTAPTPPPTTTPSQATTPPQLPPTNASTPPQVG